MQLAQAGHDLQKFSGGRLMLGLGSQIRAHVEHRYSAPWSRPAARMRELVVAIRAIWRSWNDGVPLEFEGQFYRHSLTPPGFDPGPTGYGPPPIFLGAVGAVMTEVVGEVGDGLCVHGLATERYLRQVTLPALQRGLTRAGRNRHDVEVSLLVFVASGGNDEEIDHARRAVRQQIAFYASTPAYRAVLDLEGWGALQQELNLLAKQGRWREMTHLISDEMLEAIAVQGSPNEVRAEVQRRYGDVADRVAFLAPGQEPHLDWLKVMRASPGVPAVA
jgi:probable F420-dependent oxidoreductase